MNKTLSPRSLFAAIAASLFVTIWALPTTATEATPCQKLGAAMFGHGWLGTVNPMKPVNVSLEMDGIDVSWDIPSTRPAGTVSGSCVHLRHVATGRQQEWCRSDAKNSVAIHSSYCLGITSHHNCPNGDYSFQVILKNTCGLAESWSDSVTGNKSNN